METTDEFGERERAGSKSESRKILIARDILAMDKFELQQLIREKSDRITFQENVNGSSVVWDTFRIIAVDGMILEYVCCKRCLVVYKYNSSGGTTGLNRHRLLCMANSGETNLLESDDGDGVNEDESIDMNLEQLIASVKIRPELYDGTEESVRTENLWSLIASEVEKEIDWCRKSWKSLLNKFVKRYKKMNSSNSDTATQDPWIYMDYLDFLGDHISHLETKIPAPVQPNSNPRKKRRYLKHPKLERPDVPDMEIHVPGSDSFNFINEGDLEDEMNEDSALYGDTNYSSRPKQRKDSNGFNDKHLWSINLQHQDSRKLDAHDLFCMSLAAQMRSLPAVYASKARLKISEVMHSVTLDAERRS